MKSTLGAVVALVFLVCGAMAEHRAGLFFAGVSSVGGESGSAFGGGLKYEWLFHDHVGIDMRGGYLKDYKDDMVLIPVALGPVVVLPLDSLALYLGVGGLYGILQDSVGDADPALGFYALAGIRGPISGGAEWFAEAQYDKIKGDEDTSDGYIDFNALGLNLGVLWKF